MLGIDLNSEEPAEEAEPLSLFDAPAEVADASESEATAAALLVGLKVRADMETHSLTRLYDEMEEPLMRVLGKMERVGVKVDLEQLREFAEALRTEMNEREYHFSARVPVKSRMEYINPDVYMGAKDADEGTLMYTSAERVRNTIAQLL